MEFERLLRELAQAEIDDENLHTRPSSLEERVRSHDRLSHLRAEAARLREHKTTVNPGRRRDKGVRLFPPDS